MRKIILAALALASLAVVSNLHASPFASAVVNYTPGTGINTNFTHPTAALGPLAMLDDYGFPLDVFDPPYQNDQIVSIGAGGSLTVRFDQPILNLPNNPFGRDFIIFGNAGFIITNDFDLDTFEYVGDPATDGSLFGQNTDPATISVSRDGVNFYRLDPTKVPLVDNIFPTDPTGDPQIPVNPSLTANSFAGQTATGVRSLYNSSAGGASFDISWAQDSGGNSVYLPDIQYVRIAMASGKVEIDAIAAVAKPTNYTIISEDFSSDPQTRGWQWFGDTNLFQWNSSAQNLQVTWDSAQTNSYFFMPLGTILGKNDDYSMAFDLYLTDIGVGPDPSKPYSFEIATGLQNHANATAKNFLRGTGVSSPNLAEFDFFPDSGFGATIWPGIVSSNSVFSYNGSQDYTIAELPTGVIMRVTMNYTASNQTVVTTITTNGVPIAQLNPLTLSPGFKDYRVDTFSISSYSDYLGYGSSVLAHGTIDNITVVVPPAPVQNITVAFNATAAQVAVQSQTNWNYVLERTTDLQTWTAVSSITSGSGGALNLSDPNPPSYYAVYRVRSWRKN